MDVQTSIESILKDAGWHAEAESAEVFVSNMVQRSAVERARFDALREVVVQSSVEFRDKVIYMAEPSETNPDHQSWLVSLYVPIPVAGSVDGRWQGGEPKGPCPDVGKALDAWLDRLVAESSPAK